MIVRAKVQAQHVAEGNIIVDAQSGRQGRNGRWRRSRNIAINAVRETVIDGIKINHRDAESQAVHRCHIAIKLEAFRGLLAGIGEFETGAVKHVRLEALDRLGEEGQIEGSDIPIALDADFVHRCILRSGKARTKSLAWLQQARSAQNRSIVSKRAGIP